MINKQWKTGDLHRCAILHHLLLTVIQLLFAFLIDDNDDDENDYLNTDTNERPQRCKFVYNSTQHVLSTTDILLSFTRLKITLVLLLTTD